VAEADLYRAKARILKAMAHPSRLIMLDALSQGEKCVCDLQRLVGSGMSTVSRHLSVMKSAGLLEDRREGTQVFYRLRVPCILSFFGCVEAVLKADLAARTRLVGGDGSYEKAPAAPAAGEA
jgi:ArsR family transcriptional regulator